MFLSIYPKRTKLISIDSKQIYVAKRKTVFFFSPVLLWLESFCYLFGMKPTAKRFLRFFVTILLPTISNRWAFALIIRVILCCMYNMWQNNTEFEQILPLEQFFKYHFLLLLQRKKEEGRPLMKIFNYPKGHTHKKSYKSTI